MLVLGHCTECSKWVISGKILTSSLLMLEDTNVAAWVKLLVMCVMCKYCHWGGYTVLCHIALGFASVFRGLLFKGMWHKKASGGHCSGSRVILPPSGTPWLYLSSLQSTSWWLMYISPQTHQCCTSKSFSRQRITSCSQMWFPPLFVKTKYRVANKNRLWRAKLLQPHWVS